MKIEEFVKHAKENLDTKFNNHSEYMLKYANNENKDLLSNSEVFLAGYSLGEYHKEKNDLDNFLAKYKESTTYNDLDYVNWHWAYMKLKEPVLEEYKKKELEV